MEQILFRNCRVVDAKAPEARGGMEVLIEGDRIREVSDKPIKSAGAAAIDLGGRVLMPGLIDAHAHIYLSEVHVRRLAGVPLTLMAARAGKAMRAILDRGFTTIRDAGGADWGIREAVETGLLPGPRLFIAGRALSQTGGHGDQRLRTENAIDPCGCASALAFTKQIADGVPEVRKAAREQLRQGANQIKVMVSGGVASANDPIDSKQYSGEELRAIVEEAAAWKTYVMAHAYTPESITHAVENGIRSIEHGNLIDRAAAELMARRGAFLVPTLVTYQALDSRGREFGLPAESMAKLQRVLKAGLGSLEIAKAAGVRIGFGTDLLGELQIDQSKEFLIRAQVLSAHEIIVSATATNAALLGQDGVLGIVAPGAHADLLVVDGNPLEDLNLLQDQGRHLSAIMKAGQFHKNRLAK